LTHNELDQNLFHNVSEEGLIITLILYVDDVLFIGDNTTKLFSFFKKTINIINVLFWINKNVHRKINKIYFFFGRTYWTHYSFESITLCELHEQICFKPLMRIASSCFQI